MSKKFMLAPTEPDETMIRAGMGVGDDNCLYWKHPRQAYIDMLAVAPQPPALGGEPESKLIELAAELASRRPIRSLQDLCDRQKSVSTAKLIEDVEMCGDFLAAIAVDIRHCVEASRAHLAPLQAEIERLNGLHDVDTEAMRLLSAEDDKLKADLTERWEQIAELNSEAVQLKARNSELEELLARIRGKRAVCLSSYWFEEIDAALSKPAGSEQV